MAVREESGRTLADGTVKPYQVSVSADKKLPFNMIAADNVQEVLEYIVATEKAEKGDKANPEQTALGYILDGLNMARRRAFVFAAGGVDRTYEKMVKDLIKVNPSLTKEKALSLLKQIGSVPA